MAVTDKIKRTIYFDPVSWARLEEAAQYYDTSISNLVRSATDDWIDRYLEDLRGTTKRGD